MKSAADIRAELQARVDAESLRVVSQALGVRHGNLSNFLHARTGYREVPPHICAKLGIRRVVGYVSLDSETKQA